MKKKQSKPRKRYIDDVFGELEQGELEILWERPIELTVFGRVRTNRG
jgi:hypothetical protein